MRRALELARRGEGHVEPNPMVGAVVVDDQLALLGEGWHERYGGPHAEVHALRQAGSKAAGATLYVTLEPCCHYGKTPPCSAAILSAGVRRVVCGMTDPAPHVAGGGIAELRSAGIDVEVGLLEPEARRLAAPFVKLTTMGLPWVHAKWAMTLDGKIAARTGHSRWISSEASRAVVHQLRGRMDAVIVGAETARRDDPLLTARPPGPRTAMRVVVDSRASLPLESQLLRTLDVAPVLLAVGETALPENVERLRRAGAEVIQCPGERPDLRFLLQELGKRRFTHVLVEGGGELAGSFFDQSLIDEVHVFVAPKLIGGRQATSPVAGTGLAEVPALPQLDDMAVEVLGGDVYIHGTVPFRSPLPLGEG